MKNISKLLHSKRGESYVDIAVGFVIICMLLAVALSIFGIISTKNSMDRIAEDLIETATYSGEFGEEFWDEVDVLRGRYFDFDVTVSGDYASTAMQRVQLGDDMTITLSTQGALFGVERLIPIEFTITRSGKSENYWRQYDTNA